jgi:hypothetical protein
MRKFVAFLPLLFAAAHSVEAQQNVFGCPVQPSDSIFYTRVDSLPVLPESATYTANMGGATLSFDTGFGVSVSNSHAPTINAEFNYTPAYNGVWRYPAFYSVDREGGTLGGNYGADHHTIVVDSDTCKVWETYHAYVNPANGSIETGNTCNGKACNAQSGWKYGPADDALPTQGTTDAAGLPLLPLIWRAHEIMDGTLNHPVRFTLARWLIQYGGTPQWPATGTNGEGGTYAAPYGTRYRLQASANINISSLTPQQQIYAQTIITALRQYGLVLADAGSNLNAEVDDEATMNPDIMAALRTVGGQITHAQLEVVDLSSLKPSAATYLVANGTPSVPQIMVGTFNTYVNIQAGASRQLVSWVNGPTSNKEVTWSVASGNIGSITPGGLFTPPASVDSIEQGVLKVTAVADPTASSTVYVRVLPAGPIRIAAGIQRGTITDKLGQVWQPNLFLRGGDTVYSTDGPTWPTPANSTQAAELNVYQTFAHTYGNDLWAQFVVPDGTYKVRFMFGQPYNGTSPSNCSPFPTQWHDFVSIEIQNQIVLRNFDFGASIHHACAVPVDVTETAKVTNGVLELALRNTEPDGTPYSISPTINGIEIIRED